jgi:hypothetical protein
MNIEKAEHVLWKQFPNVEMERKVHKKWDTSFKMREN